MRDAGEPSRRLTPRLFQVGDRVIWYAKWLKEKRTGRIAALHRRGTYILELDQPLPGPHRGSKTVAFGYELEALSVLRLLRQLDPAFERFLRRVLRPIDSRTIASTRSRSDRVG